jgi:hypothetical protein
VIRITECASLHSDCGKNLKFTFKFDAFGALQEQKLMQNRIHLKDFGDVRKHEASKEHL